MIADIDVEEFADVAFDEAVDLFNDGLGSVRDPVSFCEGAVWAMAGMSVCEFLSDLAVLIELNNLNPYMNVHPDDGGWFPGQHPNRSRR